MRGKTTLSALFICFGMAIGARPASAEVQVTMNAGRVTVTAKNATISQILAEWAKVGQTKIVNAERVGGGPMTIELKDVPEAEAIEIILRSAGGYVLAPRPTTTANASRFDRILILPQSAPTAPPRVAAALPPQPRPFTPPRPVVAPQPGQLAVQQPASNDNDDPDAAPVANPAVPAARPPVFNTFPQAAPQPRNEPAPPAPATSVTVPVGVSTPGMIVPTPQPAGQAGQPGVITAPQQQQPR